MLGTVVDSSQDWPRPSTAQEKSNGLAKGFPTEELVVHFREELQTFATRSLRHELAELRSQMRQDLKEELQELQLHPIRSNGFSHDSVHDAFPRDMLRNAARNDAIINGLDPPKPLPSSTPPLMAVCKPMWADEHVIQDGSLAEGLNSESEMNPEETEEPESVPRGGKGSKKWVSFARLDSLVSLRTDRSSARTTPDVSHFPSAASSHMEAFGAKLSRQNSSPGGGLKRRLSALERASKHPKKRSGRSKMHSFRRARTLPYSTFDTPNSTDAEKICSWFGQFLESSISIFIVLNGIFIGVQTDYQARHVTEDVPTVFPVMEIIFCLIFTTELCIKLSLWRLKFFTMAGVWAWNVFDFILVLFQIVEIIGMIIESLSTSPHASAANPVGNVSFLRLLRILRLFRVLRLVRLLHFIGELAMIISSIANCFRALCWTVLLLVMMIYIVAIVITQVVLTHRVALSRDGEEDSEGLKKWWGDLGHSVLSLYQATLGGVDWEVVETPLREEISWGPLLSIMFALYIAFALLAMMNIITGTFVQSALQNAEHEKTEDFRFIASDAFKNEESHGIMFDEFERTISDTAFCDWLKSMGIESADARLLFQLLDRDHAGTVDSDKLINNLVRLREGAKFMDIMKLMYEHERVSSKIDEFNFTENMEKELTQMTIRVSEHVLTQLIARWGPEAGAGMPGQKQWFNHMHSKPHGSSPHAGDSAAGGVPGVHANRPMSTPLSTLSEHRQFSGLNEWNRPISVLSGGPGSRPISVLSANRPRSAGSFMAMPMDIEEIVEEV